MSFSKLFIVTAGIIIAGSTAMAESLELGNPMYSGNGCLSEPPRVEVTPDNRKLNILFSNLKVSVGESIMNTHDSRYCNFSIPAKIPKGWSAAVSKVDYGLRIYLYPPKLSKVTVEGEYFWSGDSSKRVSWLFRALAVYFGPYTDTVPSDKLVWSGCGAQFNLVINTRLSAIQTDIATGKQTVASIGSKDDGGIVYHLQWRKCD